MAISFHWPFFCYNRLASSSFQPMSRHTKDIVSGSPPLPSPTAVSVSIVDHSNTFLKLLGVKGHLAACDPVVAVDALKWVWCRRLSRQEVALPGRQLSSLSLKPSSLVCLLES